MILKKFSWKNIEKIAEFPPLCLPIMLVLFQVYPQPQTRSWMNEWMTWLGQVCFIALIMGKGKYAMQLSTKERDGIASGGQSQTLKWSQRSLLINGPRFQDVLGKMLMRLDEERNWQDGDIEWRHYSSGQFPGFWLVKYRISLWLVMEMNYGHCPRFLCLTSNHESNYVTKLNNKAAYSLY